MSKTLVITSGYFNPVHLGHVSCFEEARELGDKLVVIVNNDIQQVFKKGKIIMDEQERLAIIQAFRAVDEAVLASDDYQLKNGEIPCIHSVEKVILNHQSTHDNFIFAKGGDRAAPEQIPEYDVCQKYNVKTIFNVGNPKTNSSTKINQLTGKE
ncbi:MAG: cytidyltransferase-like protein [Planctomycetota bacterium]|jgi:cytidyltransferase-like protein